MAARLDLVTYGENDKYLTSNPETTFFHKQVTKRPNFSINYSELDTQKENIGFGKTIRFKIPQNIGDLLKSVTLKIKADDIPDQWNLYYQDGAGVGVIEYADLIIGGTVIERVDSNYITIEKTYFNNSRQQEGVENLTGIIPQTTFSSWYGCKKSFSQKYTQKSFDFQIDIPFYFCKTPELALPICALTKQEIEIEIKFRDLKDVVFSKTSDLYGEESANFPFPTYYDENWIRDKSTIYVEMIKGWERTVYSYYKYNNVSWYDNVGAEIGDARAGEKGLGIHRYDTKFTVRNYFPYSDTYVNPSWSMIDFLKDNGAHTYELNSNAGFKWIPEMFTYSDITKVFFQSFPFSVNSTINMHITDGNKEYSKSATLRNPYLPNQVLEALNTLYAETSTFSSFSIEKTGPNLLSNVYNYQLENVYGGGAKPFSDIGKQNDLAMPFNWKNVGSIAGFAILGDVRAVLLQGQSPVTIIEPESSVYSYANGGAGFVRTFIHFPVGQGYNAEWDPSDSFVNSNANLRKSRLEEIEQIESSNKKSSDVISKGILELHFPMHDYFESGGYKNLKGIDEPWQNVSWNTLSVFPEPARNLRAVQGLYNFGEMTRVSSAGKAIVATTGSVDFPVDLRVYTWYPNKKNGGPLTPGYTVPNSSNFTRTDNIGDSFQLVWPNSRINLNAVIRGTPVNPVSDLQMSDYWETTNFSASFLDGRSAVTDNGHFALFWGHVRNITIPYSYVLDTQTNDSRGSVRIYEWDFDDWNTYQDYTSDWDKEFSIVQTLSPPDTPSYNYNFGQKMSISRTSQMLIVSEPHWVPPIRQFGFIKSQNVDWNVGRIHVYKKDVAGAYQLHQTIYPELPSYNDRLKRSRDFKHALYTSWNDPIQKRWEFGKSLDLSDDDKTLIVGADSDTTLGQNESPIGTVGGWVSVYQLNDLGYFEFKSILGQKLGDGAQAAFASSSISVTTSGNDIAVSASTADWDPETQLPFPDTSFDPLTEFATSQINAECGNIQRFSRDTKTPRSYQDIYVDMNTSKLKLELVYLDKPEQNKIKNTPMLQIVTQLQLNKFNWREYEGEYYDDDYVQKSQKKQFKLNFSNPVKEFFVITKKNNERAITLLEDSNTNTSELCFFQGQTDFDGFVRNYGNRETNHVFTSTKYPQPVMESIKSISLNLDDEEVIPEDCIGEFPSHFLRAIPSAKFHTHTSLNRRIYLWSFATRPESSKPTGQFNFSTIKSQVLSVEGFKTGWTHQHDLFVYAKSYNVLKIGDGMAQLLYPLVANGKSEEIRDLQFPIPNIEEILIGNDVITHERYQPFVDPGISLSPDLTFSSSNNINVNVIGTYEINYAIVNEHGNLNPIGFTRTVNVVDTVAPVVTLNSADSNPINLVFNDTVTPVFIQQYTEFGATADTGEPVTISITRTPLGGGNPVSVPSVNPVVEGTYTVTYTATDDGGNTGTATRIVTVTRDITPPVITLNNPNENPVNLTFNDSVSPTFSQPYTEFGATADGGETVTINSSNIVPTSEGTYDVVYTATDITGNLGSTIRQVTYTRDTTSPTLTLNVPSYNPVNLIFNTSSGFSQTYTEEGATSDGGETVTISITRTPLGGGTAVSVGAVSPVVEGVYTVTYSATDAGGNTGTITRTVTVTEDTTAPVVTLNNPNENPINLIFNTTVTPTFSQTYTEHGATADGGEAITISIVFTPPGQSPRSVAAVDPVEAGVYVVTYSATDTAGNIGTTTRTVTVTEDTVPPVLTLNNPSFNNVTLVFNDSVSPTFSQPYTEFGATSNGGETVIINSASLDPTSEGTYEINYTALDIAGNSGTISRFITYVRDVTAPIVTLNVPSYNPVDLVYNDTVSPTFSQTYTEEGATSNGGETVVISITRTPIGGGTSVSVGAVSPIVEGVYTVTYSATDTGGNVGTATRTVTVTRDAVAPVLTIQGPSYIKIISGYAGSLGIPSPPVIVTDNYDSSVPFTINDPLNRNAVGTYNIVYSATDTAQNTGTAIRPVQVYANPTVPFFTLIGGNQTILECATYTDPGFQNLNTDISETPTFSSTVNTNTIGSYTASWTSINSTIILGSTSSLTLSRTVSVQAITFTPTNTNDEAYSLFEPVIDTSGYQNTANVRFVDSTNSSYVFTKPNGSTQTVTQVTRQYRPTCNNRNIASRIIYRVPGFLRKSIAASSINPSNGVTTNYTGPRNIGTMVVRTTFTHRVQNGTSYSRGLIGHIGYLLCYAQSPASNQSRLAFRFNNGVSDLATGPAYINVPTSFDDQKIVISMTGKMVRSTNTVQIGASTWRHLTTHAYSVRVRAYAFSGTTQTMSDIQDGSDSILIGATQLSRTSSTFQDSGSSTHVGPTYALFDTVGGVIPIGVFKTTVSAISSYAGGNGLNMSAWDIDSGTAFQFTGEDMNDYD